MKYNKEVSMIRVATNSFIQLKKYLLSPNLVDILKMTDKKSMELLKQFFLFENINIDLASSELNEKHLITIYKYLVRMSFRTQPYSVFTNVDVGHIEDRIDIEISSEWIYEIIRLLNQKHINSNTIIYSSKNSLYCKQHYFFSIYNKTRLYNIILKENDPIMSIILTCSEPKEIYRLDNRYSSKAINKLIDNKLLFTEYSEGAFNFEGLNRIISLNSLADSSIVPVLKDINNLLHQLQHNTTSQTLATQLIKKMESVVEARRYLNVVSYKKANKEIKEISKIIANDNDIDLVFDFLACFDFGSKTLYYNLLNNFISEFGLYSLISLETIYSENIFNTSRDNIELSYKNKNICKDWLHQIITESNLFDHNQINLSKSDITEFIQMHKPTSKSLIDFDVSLGYVGDYITVKYESTKKGSGKYLSKYYKNVKINLNANNLSKNRLDINYLTNEYSDLSLFYYRNNIRILNIENSYNFETKYPNTDFYNLNELFITVNEEGMFFVLKNEHEFEYVVPIIPGVISISHLNENPIVKLIDYLSSMIYNAPSTNVVDFDKYSHVPRITYKNIIIVKETYIINISNNKNYQDEEIISTINHYKNKYRIKKYVCIVELDTLFPINIENEISMSILIKKLRKDKQVILQECVELNLSSSDYSGNNFDIILSANPDTNKSFNPSATDYMNYQVLNNPDWFTYILIYNNRKILLHKLLNLFSNYQYYYIHYSDSTGSIRFRIKSKDISREILEQIFELMLSEHIIKSYSYNNYFPEYTRYGGEEIMSLVENVFCIESTLNIYNLLESIEIEREELLIGMVLDFINSVFSKIEDQLRFLQYVTNNITDDYMNIYKKKSKYFNKSLETLIEMIEVPEYVKVQSKINPVLSSIKDKITRFSEKRQFYIISSILHMKMNRLTIVLNFDEFEIYYLAKNKFKSSKKYRNYGRNIFHEKNSDVL